MRLDDHSVVTFDCYGTLVDWESGILDSVRPVLAAHGAEADDGAILTAYAEVEPGLQTPYRPYRRVLAEAMPALAARFGVTRLGPEERTAILDGFPRWRPFPDTNAALGALDRRGLRLGVVSNVDDALFALTRAHLGVGFSWVITAESVRAYKPSRKMFDAAIERIALPRERILHVAESLWHDIAPAREVGLATVHVDRRAARGGAGASRLGPARPDVTVRDLMELAALP